MSIKSENLERLINQFSDSPNMVNILTSLLDRVDDTESALNSLFQYRSIDNATGVWLDIIGDILGLSRQNKSVGINYIFEAFGAPIKDAGFEASGLESYEPFFGATLSKSTIVVKSGTQSLKVVNSDGLSGAGTRIKYKYLPAASQITITGYAYTVSSSSYAQVRWDDGEILWTDSTTGAWSAINITVSVKKESRIVLGQAGNTASTIVYFDDMSVEEVQYPQRELLVDGDMEDTFLDAWTKTNSNTTVTQVTGYEGDWGIRLLGDSATTDHGIQQLADVPDNAEYFDLSAYGKLVGGGNIPRVYQSAASAVGGAFSSIVLAGAVDYSFHKLSKLNEPHLFVNGKYFILGGTTSNTNIEFDAMHMQYTVANLKDGDMELISPNQLINWTPVNGAVLLKDAGVKQSGSQSLRITSSASGFAAARQTVFTKTDTFTIVGYYYSLTSDARAGIFQNGVNRFVGDATATTWLPFSITLNTVDGLDIDFGHALTHPSSRYVYFDNIFVLDETQENFASLSYLSDYNAEDSGLTAWTVVSSATLSKDTGIYHNGTQSLKVVNSGASAGAGARQVIEVPKNIGIKYLVSGYTYHTLAQKMDILANGTSNYASSDVTSTWNKFDYIYNPHGSSAKNIDFGHNDNVSNGVFYVDDIIVTPVRGNFIADGQMETSGVTDWTVKSSATLSKTTTSPYSGTQALKIVNTGGIVGAGAEQIIVDPGTEYFYLRGWIKNEGGTSNSIAAIFQSGSIVYLTDELNIDTWTYFDLKLKSAEGLEINFGHMTTYTSAIIYIDEVNCYVPHGHEGLFNSYNGLLSEEFATDDEYRILLKAKANLYSKSSTIADIYNYIYSSFGYTSIIENDVAGQVTITTSTPLVGSERNMVINNSPVAAGIKVILAN